MPNCFGEDWIELLERKSNRLIYINTNTGKCQFKQPQSFKTYNDNHIWELLDFKTNNLYYYLGETKKTTWKKPENGTIISLVKYQIIKNRKHKKYSDKSIQIDVDLDLDISKYSPDCVNLRKNFSTGPPHETLSDAASLDNLETSGYYSNTTSSQQHQQPPVRPVTYQSAGTMPLNRTHKLSDQRDNSENLFYNKTSVDNQRFSAILPTASTGPPIRKPLPRTNPNYIRYDVTTRLSQPLSDEQVYNGGLSDQVNGEINIEDLVINETASKNYKNVEVSDKPAALPNHNSVDKKPKIYSGSSSVEEKESQLSLSGPSSPMVGIRQSDDTEDNATEQSEEEERRNKPRAISGTLEGALSLDSLASVSMQNYASLPVNKIPVNTFTGARAPRKSIISSFNRINQDSMAGPYAMEIWARDLFKKSDRKLAGLMSWSNKSIADSILSSTPKAYKRKACENFKQIQMYMCDRAAKVSKDKIAFTICSRGISSTQWANEILVQICKQVNHNPSLEHTFYGWDLMCICLSFFNPDGIQLTKSFKNFLLQYACLDSNIIHVQTDQVSGQKFVFSKDYASRNTMCARAALKLTEKASKMTFNSKDEVEKAKRTYNDPTVFHSSLDEVMDVQRSKYPTRKLPWVLVALIDEILQHGGTTTQGIIRVPSEQSKIENLMNEIECAFSLSNPADIYQNVPPRDDSCDPLLHKILEKLNIAPDPLLFASVLKYWFRHMPLSILPLEDSELPLIDFAKDFEMLISTIETLPEINYLVLKKLIRFLQILSKEEYVQYTNMPVENLVTLMAPTMFKLGLNALQPTMHILQSLIINWNTDDIDGVV